MSKSNKETKRTEVQEMYPSMALVRAEMNALNAKKLMRVNADIMRTVIRLRAALPALLALQPVIERKLPEFDMSNITRLELYLRAMMDANAAWSVCKTKNKEPSALGSEGIALRNQLMGDVKRLVSRGLVSKEAIQDACGGHGYVAIAADLVLLATVIQGAWATISSRCAATPAELDRAYEIARELTAVVQNRNLASDAERAAALDRSRVFTLLTNAYTEVRRSVQYLRYYEKDADRIAPPISGMHKGTRRKPKANAKAIDPQVLTEPLAAKTPFNEATDPQETTASKKPAIGMPGADPFLH